MLKTSRIFRHHVLVDCCDDYAKLLFVPSLVNLFNQRFSQFSTLQNAPDNTFLKDPPQCPKSRETVLPKPGHRPRERYTVWFLDFKKHDRSHMNINYSQGVGCRKGTGEYRYSVRRRKVYLFSDTTEWDSLNSKFGVCWYQEESMVYD
jgi:hypothetical protein